MAIIHINLITSMNGNMESVDIIQVNRHPLKRNLSDNTNFVPYNQINNEHSSNNPLIGLEIFFLSTNDILYDIHELP